MLTSEILEFDVIKKNLIEIAKMELTKERFVLMEMSNDKKTVEAMLKQVEEMSYILLRYGNIELYDIGNIYDYLIKASKRSILSINELYNILSSLKLVQEIKNYSINIDKLEFQEYFKLVNGLTFIDILYRELLKCIGPDLTILDSASLKLKKIRSEINNCNLDIKNKLNRIIANNTKILSDTNIIYRNGKQVLAVISSYKHSLGGVIVDYSSSGATCYVEPEEIYKLTSKISLLQEEEQEEIERILDYLTQYVVNYKEEIVNNFNNLLELDFIISKAKYGNRINGKRVIIKDEIKLIKARHPLIDKTKVVSNNFIMSNNDKKIIVISGPNTGGKSVALKTLGLLAYMNQCGLLISVDGEAILPIFDNIYLDLGDNQSIASSLSTFSSHILNIANILKECSKDSLVLLDEVGAGTDPKQGEALAISLIEEFYLLNSYLMITTHYDNLKNYALEKEYIKICAMEFDTKTLKPTYRLIENSIGKSYGFEIARLYGINETIINRANEYKEKYSNSNERLLDKLQQEIDKYEQLAKENIKLQEKLELEIKISEQKNKNLESMIEDIKNNANEEKERLIEESVKEIEDILYEIRNKDNLKMHEALKVKKNLEELLDKEEEKKSSSVFQIGDYVFIESLSLFGTITKKNKNIYSVNVGKMTVEVKNNDLELRTKEKNKNQIKIHNKVSHSKVSNELNLIGKTSSEAIYELEKFLDQARLINLSPIRIIHGYGQGILRKTVENYLKKCDFVDSYSLAGYGQGSGGVTMVYLKKRNEK